MNNNFNALIISDIHYKEDYENNETVNKYINKFIEKALELHENNPFDCLLIIGDIAFSGEANEYDILKEKMKSLLDKIPCFPIVGNHDNSWVYLKEALGEKDNINLENLFKIQNNEFIEDNSKFEKAFKNFNNFFKKKCKKDNNIEQHFCEKSFSGYSYFKKKNILLVKLNSSFKSFGQGVIEKYYREFVKNKNDNNLLKKELEKFTGGSLNQMGQQTYLFDYFNKRFMTDINNIKEEYTPQIITLCHHPPNWLNWEERFKKSNYADNQLYFDGVVKLTDLLITGHEHIPMNNLNTLSRFEHSCKHLQMGAFLDYHYVDKSYSSEHPALKFPNNWFSVLTIQNSDLKIDNYTLKFEEGQHADYKWKIDENSSNTYPFLTNLVKKPKQTPITKNKIENEQVTNKTPTLVNKNSRDIIDIIQKKRNAKFEIISEEKGFLKTKRKELNGTYVEYFIFKNSLEEAFKQFKEIETEGDKKRMIEEKPFWKDFLSIIKNIDKKQLPVIAFYDFVTKCDDKSYNLLYNKRLITFHSLKHLFFSFENFEELFIFKELKITYDCFNV